MSEVLTLTKCASSNGNQAIAAAGPVAAPVIRHRSSLARKRQAAAALHPLSGLALLPESQPPRVPSDFSLSSESSVDLSSTSSVFDSQTDLLKRSRHDSGISILSDESDSQSSLSNYSSDFSLGSAESQNSASNAKNYQFINNSLIGEFRIIGCGRDCKALHEPTGLIYDARILSDSEFVIVSRIIARLDEAEKFYSRQDIEEMKNAVLPARTQLIEEVSGRIVLFVPVFRKSLNTYAQERGVDMTELELQPVFEQIIRLMAFCHTIGIICRDLKPRKLVFDTNDKIRLQHVRDCVVLDDPSNDTVHEKFGSPAYVQPEVLNLNDCGYSGKAADMWSLGVLMYLLLIGRYPFFDTTPIGVLQKIVQARVTIPDNCQISKHAKILIYSLLRKCPEKRPSAEQLVYIPWGGAKNIPSRGNTERFLPRRIMDELLQFQSSQAESAIPVQEPRPAVSLAPQERRSASPASPPEGTDDMRQIINTARRISNIQRESVMDPQMMRQTLQHFLAYHPARLPY